MRMANLGFQEELQCCDPRFFAVWNPKKCRWQIRLWNVAHPTSWDLKSMDSWLKKSQLHHTVCFRNDEYRDVGYKPLDQRTLFTIRKAVKDSENPEVTAREVDEHNEKIMLDSDKEVDLICNDLAKRLWHLNEEPTIYLGGN